jgi:molecular chaperone Hsp33
MPTSRAAGRHAAKVAPPPGRPYLCRMQKTPAFLDSGRPDVPDIVVPRGITPFYMPSRPVRGRLIRLGPLADALLTRHENHPAVTRLAGEALALVAALASALKFRGSFSLQAKGDGPVGLLLADCTDTGALRGYAQADPKRLATLLNVYPDPPAAALLGVGFLAFTVDQGPDTERYQAIVAITGLSLAEMVRHYFETSEQLRTSVRLACARTDAGWRASALILEQVAGDGGVDPSPDAGTRDAAGREEAWRTATILAETVTDAELLDEELPSERLLYRLFGSEGIAADRPRALAYGCRCSRQRLSGILEGFGPDDLDHMAVDGDIVMTCEFCNCAFRFGRDEVRGQSAGAAPD